MSKPKIYINPGHSDTDPGAVGYEKERTLNVKVSDYMAAYLLAHYDCLVRKNPGTMGSLSAICADANSWGASLFVSNHFNAGGGDGYEALVYSQSRVPLGKIFAKHVKAIGQNLRSGPVAPGVKIRTDLSVLKYTNMPAVLNEGAFVDNLADIQDWNDSAELKKLGEAYAKAAAEYLGMKEKVTSKQTTITTTTKEGYTMNMRTLKKGSTGQDVKALQILLAGMGYNGSMGKPDGIYGTKTQAAVKSYQKAKKLTADGIAGANTLASLLGASL